MRDAQQSATTAAVASMAAVGVGTVILKAFPSARFLLFVGAYLFAAFFAMGVALGAEGVPLLVGWAMILAAPVVLFLLWLWLLALLIGEDRGATQGARILSLAVLIVASMLIPLPMLRAVGGAQGQMVLSYFVAWIVLAWVFSGIAALVGAKARWLLQPVVYLFCLVLLVVPLWVFIATRMEVGRIERPIRGLQDLQRHEAPTLHKVAALNLDLLCRVGRLLDAKPLEEECPRPNKPSKETGKPPAR